MKRYLILLSLILVFQAHSANAGWYEDKYIRIDLTEANGGWANIHFEWNPVYVYAVTKDATYKFTREHYLNAAPVLLLERAYTEIYKANK